MKDTMEVPEVAVDTSRARAGGASPHEHFVQCYESEPALVESIADFVGTGLSAGAAAIVIATQNHLEQLDERCSARGIDLPFARGEGRYVARDARTSVESLLVEGSPDAGRFPATIEPLLAPFHALAGNRDIWNHPLDGLAVLATSDLF